MTQPTDIRRVRALLAQTEPVRVLDAYCCIGGAAKGYRRAFGNCHITGVDIQAQPDYCGDAFHQGDAIEYIRAHGHEYDFIPIALLRALLVPLAGAPSPWQGGEAWVAPTRAALEATGQPFVMENVPGSAVRKDIRLCGEQFGLAVLMHRYFELGGWTTSQPAHPKHRGYVRGHRHGVYREGPYVAAYGNGGGKATVQEIRDVKGIDWSTDHLRLREALPPAYTEWIDRAFLASQTLGVAA
ncbi:MULTISPECIES: hypothetical protein [Streptomyces]|uniref:Phage DNA methylase n=1 Tax=Streptomyces sviceus (strain ATCC 29083 / DSM 924 / JCM 4929 / NBRC 13980 / NCIMB 11184 / NRRL 5439 / UC 5370) TaxID=463191 RepID=B5HU52_STRX2|nr:MULTISPECIES: hypothetical protein [Streptomyces]EDY56357.1 phage DNA methylase [Streptomyces sviceus ATCC 29083]MYT06858.1 DNA methylase [Streptomyces sp. SID5470]